jgi:hypothetical protein
MHHPSRRLTLSLGVAALAAALALPVAWYLVSPLFITRAVDEPLPPVAATLAMNDAPLATATPEMMDETMPMTETAAMASIAASQMAATEAMLSMAATQGMETALAMPTAMVSEPMPTAAPAEPLVLAQGTFYHVVHEGEGTATIFELPDGSRLLRLEDFMVLNGPDLHVYLVPLNPVPYQVGVDIDGAADLGPLKGNVGSQNYPLSPDLDLSQYQSVVIWCQPFRVPFIAAALQ